MRWHQELTLRGGSGYTRLSELLTTIVDDGALLPPRANDLTQPLMTSPSCYHVNRLGFTPPLPRSVKVARVKFVSVARNFGGDAYRTALVDVGVGCRNFSPSCLRDLRKGDFRTG